MSTINFVVDKIKKLQQRIDENMEESAIQQPGTEAISKVSLLESLSEIITLLKSETVLFLEWNEDDVQGVARQRIAHIEDVEECEIKENPLTKEQVADVLRILEKQYDCNYGITWEHLHMAMDYIDLPNIDTARSEPGDTETV